MLIRHIFCPTTEIVNLPVVSAAGAALDGGVDIVTDEPGVGGVGGQLVISGQSFLSGSIATVSVQVSHHDRL